MITDDELAELTTETASAAMLVEMRSPSRTKDVLYRRIERVLGVLSVERIRMRNELKTAKAAAFQEGIDALAQSFLRPLDEHGTRPPVVNPYLDSKPTSST